ncbi:VCBS domain-containing protein, partial [Legionella lansingensis]
VKSVDGTNQTITVTIKGTNDLPVIAGATAGLVSEEGAALLTTGGRLTISDVDTGEAAFIA